MVDIMQTDTRTLLRQRIKTCIARLNDYASAEGSVIPLDWYNKIDIDRLDVQKPYLCVFGQIFRDVELPQPVVDNYRRLHGLSPIGTFGYTKGLIIFAPGSTAVSNEWAIAHGLSADMFIVSDAYTTTQQWADLTSLWIEEIGKCRVFSSTAEGMAIIEEGAASG